MIKQPVFEDIVKIKNGNTFDIVDVVLEGVHNAKNDIIDIDFLKGSTEKETLFNVFYFIKNNITYQKDKNGHEKIQTPSRLWNKKRGDCKSLTVLVSGFLQYFEINHFIRFASYGDSENVTHVYPVAILKNSDVLIMDTCYLFNKELLTSFVLDYNLKGVSINDNLFVFDKTLSENFKIVSFIGVGALIYKFINT